MERIKLTSDQQALVDLPAGDSIFLEGPAGSGKTTAALARLERQLGNFPGNHILLLVPQRSLGQLYQCFLEENKDIKGGLPSILTLGSIARRMVELFWPLIAKDAGFENPGKQPQLLSTETAQYCMEKVISPYIEKGFFRSIIMEKNRLFSQILDNLNKSAVVQFPLEELAGRLKNRANIEPALAIAYDQVQTCALEFRLYCLKNCLLDYSLLIELMFKHIWEREECREYFYRTYQLLIADNLEEDVPVAHDLLKEWLPHLDTSLVIFDQNGGYRQFLGADPVSACSIAEKCTKQMVFTNPLLKSDGLTRFYQTIGECILHKKNRSKTSRFENELEIHDYHFYPEMIAGICAEIHSLIGEGQTHPNNIVILSPYLSDALNFLIETELLNLNIPIRSSRSSRKYLSDPSVQAVLTLAKLAHPQWGLPVTSLQLRSALLVVLPDLDVVRADLIVNTLFSEKRSQEGLRSFDLLTNQVMQERMSFRFGEKLEGIRNWMLGYQTQLPQPLDVFLSMLYGELLSQKEYSLFSDFQAAEILSKLILSIRSFRQFSYTFLGIDEISSGLEYIRSLEGGLLPSAIHTSVEVEENAVQVSPAHTFLMENRRVNYQFWLDIGSMGWWERLNQPLTNPYLLNRNLEPSQVWTEAHEFNANQSSMLRVVEGLINRCSKKIIVSAVRTNEYGSEPRGPLLQAFQTLQKRIFHSARVNDV